MSNRLRKVYEAMDNLKGIEKYNLTDKQRRDEQLFWSFDGIDRRSSEIINLYPKRGNK